MRITELLTESEIQHLDEGPKLDAFGRGVGKFAGGVAKGIGAVAGGVVGAGRALAKGYQTGKAVVGDDPDPNAGAPGYTAPVDPAARTPADGPQSTTTPPTAQQINQQGPQGTAPAVNQTGQAGQALARTTAAVDQQPTPKANQTMYAQVKANIDKLDKKGKQRILQLLQKSLAQTPAKGAAAPAQGASAAPAQGAPAAPAAEPTTAAAPAPKARGGRVAGAPPSQSPSAVRRRNARAAASAANAAGGGAFRQMANTLQQQNAGKVNSGNPLAEALAQQIEVHKQKMFETGLARGSISVFRR